MLIAFKVSNFRSFGTEVEFSCIATPEKTHGSRVYSGDRRGLRLLTIAAIFGANASGKSNLYRAVEFARNLVVMGVKLEAAIPVEPFRLDPKLREAPSSFEFQVLVDGQIMLYRFSVTSAAVVEESLREIRAASERLVFSRSAAGGDETKWDLDYFRQKGMSAEDAQFIAFVAKGTPKNQLFLREARARNVKCLNPLWQWFRQSLLLIDPQTTAGGLEAELEEEGLKRFSTRILRNADVGISKLGTRVISWESVNLPKDLKARLESDCKDGESLLLRSSEGHRLSITREKGEMKATQLVSYHEAGGAAEPIVFDIRDESDGTQRIVDLLPAFHQLANADRELAVFIDELDRSLHSRLTRALVEGYLSCRPVLARTQLLFTTHDVTLLDHELLRKDEVWMIDKNEKGESELSSLSEYKLRSDKRLMKDYLLGRFGGVPNVHRLPLRPALAKTTGASSSESK
ncbi:MAG TPA: ATP-binding protein [Clostridia bacterium]|nr:ATP-binding protein [Clostridia bacterium]